jgi:hypothetical protein
MMVAAMQQYLFERPSYVRAGLPIGSVFPGPATWTSTPAAPKYYLKSVPPGSFCWNVAKCGYFRAGTAGQIAKTGSKWPFPEIRVLFFIEMLFL